MKTYGEAYVTNPEWGYFFVAIKQGNEYCTNTYIRTNIALIMTNLGGFLGTSYLITSTLLSGYMSFVFDKSLMKRLYY